MRKTTSLPFLMVLLLMTALDSDGPTGPPRGRWRSEETRQRAGTIGSPTARNPGETRYSPLKQIDATNVSRLGLAWSYDIGQGGGNQEATPLV